MSDYNKKYKDKLNFFKIIQSGEEEYRIINKICNYLLNLFYDIEEDELEDVNNEENKDIFEFEEDEKLHSEENEENSEKLDSDNIIICDEFEPELKKNYKYK